MALVTDAEVKTIIDTTIDTSAFITTADIIVSENLASAGYTDARLKQIELWLTAHFVCQWDKRVSSEKIGDASNTYEGKTGMGLDSSSYGQQVKLLDTQGILANMDKPKATIETIKADLTRTDVLRRAW